jgi:AraC family transcriptional regulator, transcriptional activator of the genes for pyochelin and ferripyochelin receptors
MDKIVTQDWANIFSHKEQKVIHDNGRYMEMTASFNEPGLASGVFHTITTPGMILRQINFSSEKDLLLIDTEEEESTNSLFILNGGVDSKFSTLTNPISFNNNKHGFQYNTNFQAEHLIRSGEFKALNITFDLTFFKNLVQSSQTSALNKLSNSLEKKENFVAFPSIQNLQPRMADVITAIQHCRFNGLTRYLFLEAKMLELFALQIEDIEAANGDNKAEKINRGDLEKLKAVKEYIDQNFLEPLSLKKLTYMFALNEFKLKKGYKELFGTSVFGHILTLRMHKAKNLLAEKVMNVSETAYFIGYNNVSSFSAEFKKRFGYSPCKYLKNY